MKNVSLSNRVVCLTGAVGVALATAGHAHASPSADEITPPRGLSQTQEGSSTSKFDFMVECDPLFAHGTGSGYQALLHRASNGSSLFAAENRLGLRPPKCLLEGTQDGGTFACECADGQTSNGTFSAMDALAVHKGFVDSFEWCERKVQEACGPLTPRVESICENEHGVCSVTAYSRSPDLKYSELEQTCECHDERAWMASTPTTTSFEFDKETLDQTCRKEVAHCVPEKSEQQASSALALPEEILSHPKALGCMNLFGTCQVYSDKYKHWSDCECFAQENEGFGVEGPGTLDSIQEMLGFCKRELEECPAEQLPDPEEEDGAEPDSEEDQKDSDTEPGCPKNEELPKGSNVEPKPEVLPVGCAIRDGDFGGFWGLLALPGFALLARRRRRGE